MFCVSTVGYIDLSKRRVSAEDVVKCEERYNKGKMVASIMRHVAEKTRTPMEELYSHIGWPLNKKYGNALDAFKMSITYAPILPTNSPHSLPTTPLTGTTATQTSGQASPSPTTWSKTNSTHTSPSASPHNPPKSAQTWK